MKDIKSYVIGFLTCACLFLIMGQNVPPHLQSILDEEKKEGLEGRIAELEAKLNGEKWVEKIKAQEISVGNIQLIEGLMAKGEKDGEYLILMGSDS